ncbi:MAG: dephospho-CoA kinase [Flavobacteriales bacterium]|mgnify:FL=1|jgi:dephospho-CoA kinase|nr:dephospho-CoA kinase [Flavobacteriales bacterium]MBT6699818.1 dephospho-CoA kinase [Flavobacteriales bacterium]MBT6815587.1 dephospho-CoA kinase [Flavobacteriales bacterium]
MKKIGITGGIGSGKTYVASVFQSLGIPIFNADIQAKKIMTSSRKLIKLLKEEFGNDIYKDSDLNKEKLASIVFSNSDKLQKLNSLVHPIVKEEFNNWCKKQTSPYVIKEAAILFESNSHIGLDAVICVSAPLDLRMRRLLNRDDYSKKEIKKRIENQISQEEKEKLSDYIIVNDEKDLLLPKIIKFHKELLS